MNGSLWPTTKAHRRDQLNFDPRLPQWFGSLRLVVGFDHTSGLGLFRKPDDHYRTVHDLGLPPASTA
jgi:hypothetical protein